MICFNLYLLQPFNPLVGKPGHGIILAIVDARNACRNTDPRTGA
jgi:hypothetical protein